jgi:hypothetical protein
MSELLMNGLVTTKRELEAGLADAEAELARAEEYCHKLEELIAVGKATLHAASQVSSTTARSTRETAPRFVAAAPQIGPAPVASQNGQTSAASQNGNAQATSDLEKRLVAKEARN